MERITLTREELYEQVWTTPVSKLAAAYGISDVALAKVCKKYTIPKPGLGYWARKAVGHKLTRPKLPKAPPGVTNQITLTRHISNTGEPRPAAPAVEVSERLNDPHPMVVWLKAELDGAKKDKHGRLMVGHEWSPEVCIRPSSVPRALRLLDALVKALLERGHEVKESPEGDAAGYADLRAVIVGETISVEIEEKLARKPHVLTAEERSQQAKWGWSNFPKYDYYPDGELAFRIRPSHYKYGGRKTWSDTKVHRLDDSLGSMILSMEQAAEIGRRERDELDRQAREREQRERIRLRGERMQWYRKWLVEDLHQMATDWAASRQIREFLAAYAVAVPSEFRTPCVTAWLDSAKQYAENLDPLGAPGGVAKILEPSDEVLEKMVAEHKREAKAPS